MTACTARRWAAGPAPWPAAPGSGAQGRRSRWTTTGRSRSALVRLLACHVLGAAARATSWAEARCQALPPHQMPSPTSPDAPAPRELRAVCLLAAAAPPSLSTTWLSDMPHFNQHSAPQVAKRTTAGGEQCLLPAVFEGQLFWDCVDCERADGGPAAWPPALRCCPRCQLPALLCCARSGCEWVVHCRAVLSAGTPCAHGPRRHRRQRHDRHLPHGQRDLGRLPAASVPGQLHRALLPRRVPGEALPCRARQPMPRGRPRFLCRCR